MKRILILTTILVFACSSDDSSEDSPLPTYTIEGKWIWSPTENISDANTMYLYEDGIRYTYYCTSEISNDCQSLFQSFQANDGNHLPTTNPYTFQDNVLTVDLHFGNELITPIAFGCDGGEAYFETPEYSLFRLNSNCN